MEAAAAKMRLFTQHHGSAGKAMAMMSLCYGNRQGDRNWGGCVWMQTIVVQWRCCNNSFWGDRVASSCQKQQIAINN